MAGLGLAQFPGNRDSASQPSAPPPTVAAASATPPPAAVAASSEAKARPERANTPSGVSFKTDPIGAIGLILGNIGAAIEGNPLPSDAAIKQNQAALAAESQQAKLAVETVGTIWKMTDQLVGGQRLEAMLALSKPFQNPDLDTAIKELMDTPNAEEFVRAMSVYGDQVISFLGPGFTAEQAKKFLTPENVKMFEAADDVRLRGSVAGKLANIGAMLQAGGEIPDLVKSVDSLPKDENGDPVFTESQVASINDRLPDGIRLDPREMGVALRNPEMFAAAGFTVDTTALKAQEEGAMAAAKEAVKPEQERQAQSPEGKLMADIAAAGTEAERNRLLDALDKKVGSDDPVSKLIRGRREALRLGFADEVAVFDAMLAARKAVADRQAAGGEKADLRSKKISDLVKLGLSEADAIGRVDGYIRTVVNQDGRVFLVNELLNTKKLVPSGKVDPAAFAAGQSSISVADLTPAQFDKLQGSVISVQSLMAQTSDAIKALEGTGGTDTFGLTNSAIGPGQRFKNFLANTAGLLPGALGRLFTFRDTAQNRQNIKSLREALVSAFLKNPRAPLEEQQRLRDLFPDPDAFFRNPEESIVAFRESLRIIANRLEVDRAQLEDRPPDLIPAEPTGTALDPYKPKTIQDMADAPVGAYVVNPETGQTGVIEAR